MKRDTGYKHYSNGKWNILPDRVDVRMKKMTGDKDGHYIKIKESTQQEEITIING